MIGVSSRAASRRLLVVGAIFTWTTMAAVSTATRFMIASFTTLSPSRSSRLSNLGPNTPAMALSRQIEMAQQTFGRHEENNAKPLPLAELKNKSTDPTPVVMSAMQEMFWGDADFDFTNLMLTPTTAVSAVVLALLLLLPLAADAAMSGGRMGGSFSSNGSAGHGLGFGSGSYRVSGTGIALDRENAGIGLAAVCLTNFAGLLFVGTAGLSTTSDGDNSLGDGTTSLGSGTSVVQVTVALNVPNRDDPNCILSVLHQLSQTAQTNTRVGIQNLTSQVASELLQRKLSILSASTQYQHFYDRSKALNEFNSLSIQERGKFEQEIICKYGGVDYSPFVSTRRSSTELVDTSKATVAVVTILMAINGDSTKIPTITSMQNVDVALRKVASDATIDSCLQAAEILWTPEDRFETLTLDDVMVDYPKLRSV